MQEIIEYINIEDMIYEINGVQVMLDSDLAKLYHVETKRINEAVKNNPEKFPKRFSWILDNEEISILRSKFSTLEIKGQGKYSKYIPRVFTEQGVYMLATILKSKEATQVSIRIMDTFVNMRKYFASNTNILLNHENRILILEKNFTDKEERLDKILFEGHLYDAYSIFLDILNSSIEEIIIIDNYVSKELLDILKNINRKILVVSKNIDEALKKKYESQYDNVSFIYNNSIHDRFIIIDRKTLYTSGSSFKDIGKKCFYIGKIENIENLKRLLSEINL